MRSTWLAGGGECGALMRAHDWSASPLGPPEGWPQSLRTVVGLLLSSKFPMFVAWGSELGFLYNDAYAEVLGAKHPAAMGARFHDIWREIWPDIWPLIERAMAGEGSFHEDLPLLMNRKGFDEQTWFTFSYSPVRGDDGQVAGMFCACVETTRQVTNERRQALLVELDDRLQDLDDVALILGASVEILGGHLGADRTHWARVDDADDRFEVMSEWTRASAPGMASPQRLSDFGEALISEMRAGATVAVGDLASDGLASAGRAEAAFGPQLRALLAIPLIRSGAWQSALCVHSFEPRVWRDDERELIREVAERAWTRAQRAMAEAKVRESEQRFRALVNATSDVVYRVSADWREMRQLDGRGFLADVESPRVAWIDEYVPAEDRAEVRAAINDAIRRKGVFQHEHRVRRVDGSIGWTLSRAIPVLDPHDQVLEWFGTASDITVRKAAEEHLRLMVNELNHRVKNSLATVQAIAAQTLRRGEIPEAVREALVARLVALADAHDVLTDEKWSGADLAEIAAQAAAPYANLRGASPFRISGPSVYLPPKTAIALALAFHELATNAAKYGALSTPAGEVDLAWNVEEASDSPRLRLTWREAGGPQVTPPRTTGFGTRLIQQGLASELGGRVDLDFRPEGLACTVVAQLRETPAHDFAGDLQLG